MQHSIATLGSHSALDVCDGAKAEGFETIVVCQKGRDSTYSKYYKTRKRETDSVGIVDDAVVLDKFKDIVKKENQQKLNKKNAIFVPNRSFAVYVGYDAIENEFKVPVFGNKFMLRAEERDTPKNQYDLMKRAGIRSPLAISSPQKIDRLSIVKVSEAKRTYERAFFLARNYEEYLLKSQSMLRSGKITKEHLESAKIEEYVVGAYFNLNFFYSPLNQELELLGIDFRRQTNLDGFLRMPTDAQQEALKYMQPSTIEVGHVACTLRESLLDQAFDLGERFVSASQKEYSSSDGIKGPFALQCAITEEGKEEFVCFDISMRMPGSPGTRFTPYSEYLHRKSISFGRRVAMEVKAAEKMKKMDEITS
ncbi:DUF1297 domain-containing protein [Candidatus Micrarchaeota archaeon]|nr:DUF1297 domain-containing protein [Candidatus Micrarchaeota archaeon]